MDGRKGGQEALRTGKTKRARLGRKIVNALWDMLVLRSSDGIVKHAFGYV